MSGDPSKFFENRASADASSKWQLVSGRLNNWITLLIVASTAGLGATGKSSGMPGRIWHGVRRNQGSRGGCDTGSETRSSLPFDPL